MLNIENLKFLVIDDSKIMLKIITNVLSQINIKEKQIFTAENGLEGLNIFKKEKIDIILTDWNMPIMNGLQLIQEVRKINQEVFICMITTEGEKQSIILALKSGANNYVVKPFTAFVLKEKLNQILNK